LLYRVLQLVPVTLVVIILNFLLVHLAPGDVSIILAGESADPAYLASIVSAMGWTARFSSSSGATLSKSDPVISVSPSARGSPFLPRSCRAFQATLLLVGTSLALSVVLGTWIGTWIARKPGSAVDSTVSAIAVALFSMPVFWLGLMLVLLFAVELQVCPRWA
jgi:peptide/nickel transport system permease protein